MAPSRWNFESAIPIIRPSCKNDVVFKFFFFFPSIFPFTFRGLPADPCASTPATAYALRLQLQLAGAGAATPARTACTSGLGH